MTRSLRFRDIIAPPRKIVPFGWRSELVPGSRDHSEKTWSDITAAHRAAGRTLTPRSIVASQLHMDAFEPLSDAIPE